MMTYIQKLLQHAFADSVEVLELTDHLCRNAIFDKIPGDFCEAGCAYGVHGVMMKNTIPFGMDKKVILFDSFEGISVHGPNDIEWTEHYGESVASPRESGGITAARLEDVKETMFKFLPNLGGIEFRKGWFIDTFPRISPNERYSVLRLDCDLYDPYKLCLEYLYPRLSKGGYLIIDDFKLSGCRQALMEYGLNPEAFTVRGNIAYLQKKN